MAVPLVILTDPRDARPRRELTVAAGTRILAAAHDAGIDITATCGGRGRCTSCRVRFVEGTIPPPTIMDEVQLGADLVREGYRLSCQCAVTERVVVHVAPPLEEHAFQILGAGAGARAAAPALTIDTGVAKELLKVALPRDEHHQTSDLECLAAAAGVPPESVAPAVLATLPQALRDDPAGVTVTTFRQGGRAGAARHPACHLLCRQCRTGARVARRPARRKLCLARQLEFLGRAEARIDAILRLERFDRPRVMGAPLTLPVRSVRAADVRSLRPVEAEPAQVREQARNRRLVAAASVGVLDAQHQPSPARACRELDIETVAVYSDADRESLHVKYADYAYRIGRAPSRQSYLAIDRIIEVCKKSRAEAVHPGYGFLAENAGFAQRCKAEGIVFIGPSPEVIDQMGDKVKARQIMKAAGVPVVPGSDGILTSEDEVLNTIESIGYPCMLKAVAGGGGKGLRLVRSRREVSSAFRAVVSEAASSFGDARLYVEKFIEKPRHVEIQILADNYGRVIHLYDRECSIQPDFRTPW